MGTRKPFLVHWTSPWQFAAEAFCAASLFMIPGGAVMILKAIIN